MSLKDGTKKMSKSDASDASRINMTDSSETIFTKVKKSKTDSIEEITYDQKNRPEVTNLINIFVALSGYSIETILTSYQYKGFSDFKLDLAELIITHLKPINNEYSRIIKDKNYIHLSQSPPPLWGKEILERFARKDKNALHLSQSPFLLWEKGL
jgi:tryptophanyl-tRNA synthetase